MKRSFRVALASVASLALLACSGNDGSQEPLVDSSPALSFDAFEHATFREEGTGVYIVEHDMAIANREALHDYFMRTYAPEEALIVATHGGVDTKWDATQQHNLTYCVSSTFGSRQAAVITAMADATHAWESAADLKWTHVAAEDAHCDGSNTRVTFDVNPVNVLGRYLARSFFPDTPRAKRNVLIDNTAFGSHPTHPLISVTGVLRHELGHTIGFRHEQTRPEAHSTTCFEDNQWRVLTPYDSNSVMHYPQCNGTGDWSLSLTASDRTGVALLYGAAHAP